MLLLHHHNQCGICSSRRGARRPAGVDVQALWRPAAAVTQTLQPLNRPAPPPAHTASYVSLPEPLHISHPSGLTIPIDAMPTLFQSRAANRASQPSKPGSKRHIDSLGTSSDGQQPPLQVVLTLQIDGVQSGRQELVDLRWYSSKRVVQVCNHRCFDLLEGRLLLGWKRDAEGRLVALLATPTAAGGTASHSVLPPVLQEVAAPAQAAAQSHAPGRPTTGIILGGVEMAAQQGLLQQVGQLQQEDAAGLQSHHPMPGHHWSNISASNLVQRMHNAGLHMQQQLASSAANAAALLSAAGVAGAAAVMNRARCDCGDRHRTYVPARIRPVMNEVYVPFGLWRDLYDGSDRPFPKEGLPLRVSVTGAVRMAAQPALLVRRITPYGYYVMRGIKGLNRLKGKLMVRWSLLVNGVLELEVAVANSSPPEQLSPYSTTAAPDSNHQEN